MADIITFSCPTNVLIILIDTWLSNELLLLKSFDIVVYDLFHIRAYDTVYLGFNCCQVLWKRDYEIRPFLRDIKVNHIQIMKPWYI